MNPLGALLTQGAGAATGLDLNAILGSFIKTLLSQLLAKQDTAGLQTMKDLSEQRQNASAQDTVAATPMPFSREALPGGANSSSGANSAANHTAIYGMLITQRDNTVVPRTGGKLPEVDGSDAGWQKLADAAKSGIIGSPEAQERVLHGGKNPWDNSDGNRDERIAALWAMQQNPNIRYDADKKEFFTQGADGSKTKVANLADVQKTINDNGGYGTGNGQAMKKVGELLNGKIDTSPSQLTTIALIGFQFDQSVDQITSQKDDPSMDVKGLLERANKIKDKLNAIDEGVNAMQPMMSYTQTISSASISA